MKRLKPSGSYQKQKPGATVPDIFLKSNETAGTLDEPSVSGEELMDDVETESCISGVEHDLAFLVDINDVKQTKTKGGAPKKPILDLLLCRCYHISNPERKQMYRCVAEGCGHTLANRGVRWAVRHAIECDKLDSALKQRASEEAALLAPSNRLENTLSRSTDNTTMVMDVDDKEVEDGLKDGPDSSTDSFKPFRARGVKQRQAAADLAVVKLFCAAGLPTYLATYPEWHALLTTLCPTYKPADRTKLEEVHIVSEAACVRNKTLDILRAGKDLTLSYDGGTSRGRESFWTIHVSTSDHRVYFMEGREATRESHTGEWIRNVVSAVRMVSTTPSLTDLIFLFR